MYSTSQYIKAGILAYNWHLQHGCVSSVLIKMNVHVECGYNNQLKKYKKKQRTNNLLQNQRLT